MPLQSFGNTPNWQCCFCCFFFQDVHLSLYALANNYTLRECLSVLLPNNNGCVHFLNLIAYCTELEKFIAANTQELGKDKWLCPLSGKKFKGPEFVRKHILTKHTEKMEELKKDVSVTDLSAQPCEWKVVIVVDCTCQLLNGGAFV